MIVHPEVFDPSRLAYENLSGIVDRSTVRLRGWDYPHVSSDPGVLHFDDHIGTATDWRYYREVWNFYQSAQFAYVVGVHEDWVDLAPDGWRPPEFVRTLGALLGIGDTVYRVVETYEFASRLADEVDGTDRIVIRIELRGMKNRRLWLDDRRRAPLSRAYRCDDDVITQLHTHTRVELAEERRSLALVASREIFLRFGWAPSTTLLGDLLSENAR